MTNGEATSEPAITTSRAESIADHMYRMSMMCMFAPSTLLQPTDGRPGIDVSRAMKMALVHDLGESIVGDITPMDGIDKEEKHRRELSAITWIAQDLCGGIESLDERGDTVKGAVGREIQELWEEYEAGRTLTSRFVKDIDKMELVVQTVEYEKESGGRTDLSEFMWVCEKIELPEMKQWCRELIAEREAFQKSVSRPKQSSSTAETHKKRDLVDEYYA